MKVSKLIELLQEFDGDTEVTLDGDVEISEVVGTLQCSPHDQDFDSYVVILRN